MDKASDEAKSSEQVQGTAPRKKRRRKRQYTDEMYGARPEHGDARFLDEYARLNGLERTEVVRIALHKFVLLQQMKYPRKDGFQELQERVFREHFAALFERLEALSATLQELPQEVAALHLASTFRVAAGGAELCDTFVVDGEKDGCFLRHVESILTEQKRTLEQVLLASTLALRLAVNYLVEPQLRSLEASNRAALEPHLRAAQEGKAGWSEATSEVVRRTGKQVLRELNFATPEKESGTSDAPTDEP